MSEIKITITAPELSEAINNLARAIGLAVTNPVEMTIGVVPTNTTSAVANESTPAQETPQQVTPAANPTAHTTAPQYAPAVPTTPNVNYPTDATQSVAQPVNVTPVPPVPIGVAPTAPAVPTAAPTFTLEMLSKAGADLVDMGKMDSLMMLLQNFGVEAITSLNPEYYGAFATELRNLGAQI